MTRAEEQALKACPKRGWKCKDENGNEKFLDANRERRLAYIKGYERALDDIKALVGEYEKKGERCYEQSEDNRESSHCFFWDGFKNCATNLLRELDKKDVDE